MKHLSSILLVLTAVTVLAVEQSSSITIRGWQFDFPAFLKQEATAGPDFTVTYFTSTERKITVGIYEGMHPQQFADKHPNVTHEQALIDGQTTSWSMWETGDTNKEYHAELYLDIVPGAKPVEKFHIFANTITREDLILIQQAVNHARKTKSKN